MKSYFTNALCGTEEDISCDNSDLDRPDLKMDLKLHWNFQFCVDLCFLLLTIHGFPP